MLLSKKAVEMPEVAKLLEDSETKVPAWLERKAAAGQVLRTPGRSDVAEPFSESDIVEFYSR